MIKIETVKQIYERAYVKDRLFWFDLSDENIDRICSMDNNPKDNVRYVRLDKLQNRIIELGSQGKSLMDLYNELGGNDA